MQAIKLTGIIVLITCACLTTRAQESNNSNSSTNSSGVVMDVKVVNEELAGLEHLRRAFVTIGDSQFTLVVPDSFRLDQSDNRKLSLISKETGAFISVGIVDGWPRDSSPSAQTCRNLLLNEFPKAEVTSEFQRSAGGRSGPAFDLKYTPAGGTEQSVRAAFIPSPAGVLAFKLVASPTNFISATYDLNALLLSLQAGQAGKLEVTPLSNML